MENATSTINPLLVLPVVLSALWILWDVLYSSFFFGFVVKTLINLFLKNSGVHIGNLRVSVLTGRVLFKDVHYYCRDYSFRIGDGHALLRWWKKPTHSTEEVTCKQCSNTSHIVAKKKTGLLFLQLNGFQFHWYNRSEVYDQWGQKKTSQTGDGGVVEEETGWFNWKNLQPTVHCSFSKGRMLFGNHMVEKTLVIYFSRAEGHYSMTQASNPYDELMHLVEWHGDNIKAVLEPSHGYNKPVTESPPPTDGSATSNSDSYLLMKTDSAECVYSVDIPGLVPLDDTSSPKFSFDTHLGNNTVVNYGCYANRQRAILQHFFFPNDYTMSPVDKLPQPGEKRIYTQFDVSVTTSSLTLFKFIFYEKNEVRWLSLEVKGHSTITVNQPWVTKEDGYTSIVTGTLTHVEMLSSLSYPPLGQAEMIQTSIKLHFPRVWNTTQTWDMNFLGDKAQASILFQYIDFFNALLVDWLGDEPPDLLQFVPLDWRVGIDLTRYEIFLHTSRYNWLDTCKERSENNRLAFCGQSGHISLELPFTEFLPKVQRVSFSAQGHDIVVRRYVSPSCGSRESLYALSTSNRYRWRVPDIKSSPQGTKSPLSQTFSRSTEIQKQESVDSITASSRSRESSSRETWRTAHTQRQLSGKASMSRSQAAPSSFSDRDMLTEEDVQVEVDHEQPSSLDRDSLGNECYPMGYCWETQYENGWLDLGCGDSITVNINYYGHNHDTSVDSGGRPTPSLVRVDIDAPVVYLRVYGFFAKDLLCLKENYVSEYMNFKVFNSQSTFPPPCDQSPQAGSQAATREPDPSDGPHDLDERFLDVIVDFKLRNATGEFPTHLSAAYPRDFPLPSGHTDMLDVYVEYHGCETTVRLRVEPFTVHLPTMTTSTGSVTGDPEYSLGHVSCNGADFLCQGFTEFLLQERVEYGWLMKLIVDKIAGNVSVDQLCLVADWFLTALSSILCYGDDVFKAPDPILIEPRVEPLSELIKYKLFALAITQADVCISDGATLTRLQSPGLDLSLCNLHHSVETLGVSLQLRSLTASSYIRTPADPQMVLECAHADIGTIHSDINLREEEESMPERQLKFLMKADSKTHRLYFLWDSNAPCGCCGGCPFLDDHLRWPSEPQKSSEESDIFRYFSAHSTFVGEEGHNRGFEPFPVSLGMSSFGCIERLHNTLVDHHNFQGTQPPSDPLSPVRSAAAAVVLNTLPDDTISQGSDSFWSAKSSLTSLNELDKSIESSPHVEPKLSRHRRKPSRADTATAPSPLAEHSSRHRDKPRSQPGADYVANYQNALDCYKCRLLTLKVPVTSQQHGTSSSTPAVSSPQSQRGRRDEVRSHRPCFLLRTPELTVCKTGHIPTVVPKPSAEQWSTEHHQQQTRDQEQLGFVSVSVSLLGNVGIMVSPPFLSVLERYASKVDNFFTSRSCHAYLDAISFDSLGTVQSQLAKTISNAVASPKLQLANSPLLHLSVSMSPGAYGAVQVFQNSTISMPLSLPVLPVKDDSPKHREARMSPLVTIYVSGAQCSALVYHHSSKTNCLSQNTDQETNNVQMVVKISSKLHLPVLQAGLFSIVTVSPGTAVSSTDDPQSILNFSLRLPDCDPQSYRVVNLAEGGLRHSSAMLTAKIVQSEWSTDPVLLWNQLTSHHHPPRPPPELPQSELSTNSIAVDIKLPSFSIRLNGPPKASPSQDSLLLDPSLVAEVVATWKPRVTSLVTAVDTLLKNKRHADRKMLFTLLTSATEIATIAKVRHSLLNDESLQLRESVVYAIILRMWHSLTISSDNMVSVVPDAAEDIKLELLASSLALAAKVWNQHALGRKQQPAVRVPSVERGWKESSATHSVGYVSISPSPSELAVPNVLFVASSAAQQDDIKDIAHQVNFDEHLLLREALLPLFSAAGLKVPSQLKVKCHNSSEINMEYNLSLSEGNIVVVDRSVSGSTLRLPSQAHKSESVLLVHQVCVSGSLKYLVKNKSPQLQNTSYLVTTKSPVDMNTTRQYSNITSKFSVRLDSLVVNITFPLMMICRHSSESFRHWLTYQRQVHNQPRKHDRHSAACVAGSTDPAMEEVEETDQQGVASAAWTTSQQLVEWFLSLEKDKNPPLTVESSRGSEPSRITSSNIPMEKHKLTEYAHSPKYPRAHRVAAQEGGQLSSGQSYTSLTSGDREEYTHDVVIKIEPTPPVSIKYHSHSLEAADDTTDSPQMLSSDNDTSSSWGATYNAPSRFASNHSRGSKLETTDHVQSRLETPNLREGLSVVEDKLRFSVFGLVKISTIQVRSQLETLLTILEIQGVTGAVDCRKMTQDKSSTGQHRAPGKPSKTLLVYKVLPTYLSVASTLKKCSIRVSDTKISRSDLAVLSAYPAEFCASLYYGRLQAAPAYRMLFRLPLVTTAVNQPPVVIHKQFFKYLPSFTVIYNEVFAPTTTSLSDGAAAPVPAAAATVSVSDLQFPPHLPQGSALFYLNWFHLVVSPLPSLSVTYKVSPVTAQLETSAVVNFSLNVGQHSLEFDPKEHKDELSLRCILLPLMNMNGRVVPSPTSRLPRVTLELAIKQVIVDVTTDVLNQLLILQTSFIKEVNELINMFFNIGESITPERLDRIKQQSESGNEFLSLLSSVKFSVQGVQITVSTPLRTATAIRFSTGNKIEMLITNQSHQQSEQESTARLPQNLLFALHGKVETEINVALGYLQEDIGVEDEDDFVELAYFKTWIAVRNTFQQNAAPLLAGMDSEDDDRITSPLDTFVISIHSPHLYIQSSAVEKAILFWVNCKSVYNFWQNEYKQLNAEVQHATEAIVERITKPPAQLRTPSIDFSKPRLVQISVSDAGACMPLIPQPTTPHSSVKGFPALVLTVKAMQVSVNLSKRLASAGKFSGFCIRFDEQFHFRHKTWTVDPKKHKFLNYGVVPSGTYRLCIVNRPRFEGGDSVGEKLVSAFTWNMSGVDINSTTDIGRHISTLVKTLTAIGSEIEDPQAYNSPPPTAAGILPHHSPRPSYNHRRTHSITNRSDELQALRAMELDLARQTRKLQKLRLSGAEPDSLRSEEDTFQQLEKNLYRGIRRVLRGKKISLQQLGQILYPRSPAVDHTKRRSLHSLTLPRRRLLTHHQGMESSLTPLTMHSRGMADTKTTRTHTRFKSDISELLKGIQVDEDTSTEQGSEEQLAATQQSVDTINENTEKKEEPVERTFSEEEKIKQEKKDLSKQQSEPLIPSIDIEINVTINIDCGSIVLHSEDVGAAERRSSSSWGSGDLHSTRAWDRSKQHTSVVTSIAVPALEVRAHYQAIVGKPYSTTPVSPMKSLSAAHTPRGRSPVPTGERQDSIDATPPFLSAAGGGDRTSFAMTDEESARLSGLPVMKKGVLSITAIVGSVPQDVELNPSLMEFVEQVVRPVHDSIFRSDRAPSPVDEEDGDESVKQSESSSSAATSRPLSFPVDVCITFQMHPSKVYLTCNPHSRVRCMIAIPTISFAASFSLFSRKIYELPGLSPQVDSSIHGASIADDITMFNNLCVTGCLQTFALVLYTPQVQTSNIKLSSAKIEDKEAFNLLLGQAFIHLSRKSVFTRGPPVGSDIKSVDDYTLHQKTKVSVIPLVESLCVAYDMRRLNDVAWFRKCWYNTGLVEAIFIGSGNRPGEPSTPQQSMSYSTTTTPHADSTILSLSISGESSAEPSCVPEESDTITAEISVAASVTDLRLLCNMAQVMGNTHVLMSHLKCEGHADIQHNELVLLSCDGAIGEVEGEAQGGVLAGNVKIGSTEIKVSTSSQDGCIPEHKVSASIGVIQGHIDYMSAHILLLRASELCVVLSDEWKGLHQERSSHQEPAQIHVEASFTWNTLQISIHRSTTKCMFGIAQRLYEFVMQQKKRSERTISLMLPAGTAVSSAFAAYQEEQKRAEESRAAENENPLLEYHHWLWAVRVGSLELMRTLGINAPHCHHDVSLGGCIKVSGQNMCLVCFHGSSFRDSEWAVFNVDLINASFSTLALPGVIEGDDVEMGYSQGRRLCQQVCTLRLGHKGALFKELAAIYHVSTGRSGVLPMNPRELHNWLKYVCIDHYIHASSQEVAKPSSLSKFTQKLTIQPILCMPAFEVKLINDHFWPSLHVLEKCDPRNLSANATVECSFFSTFSDGISVTTTVDNYLFLHDLITSYIDHLEKSKLSFRPPFIELHLSASSSHPPAAAADEPISFSADPAGPNNPPLRRFINIHWELNPNLLLLSKAQWASGQFNPHVNWLLERLGFEHARTTIPECIQRGLMDPIDLAVSISIELLVKLSATKKVRQRGLSPEADRRES